MKTLNKALTRRFTFLAAVSFGICILLAAMWVASYFRAPRIAYTRPEGFREMYGAVALDSSAVIIESGHVVRSPRDHSRGFTFESFAPIGSAEAIKAGLQFQYYPPQFHFLGLAMQWRTESRSLGQSPDPGGNSLRLSHAGWQSSSP